MKNVPAIKPDKFKSESTRMVMMMFVNDKKANAAKQHGFTLLELLVVVAVIGIIAAFAYPSYKDSIIKGWRAEGRAALATLMIEQERYINQTGQYQVFAAGGVTSGFTSYSGSSQSSSAYVLGARACTGKTLRECVVVFGKPSASKADPLITELTLDSTGTKSCTGATTSVCWP
jgi:type IV pilus assembly protein PilE